METLRLSTCSVSLGTIFRNKASLVIPVPNSSQEIPFGILLAPVSLIEFYGVGNPIFGSGNNDVTLIENISILVAL